MFTSSPTVWSGVRPRHGEPPRLPIGQITLEGDTKRLSLITEVGALTAEVRNLKERIEAYEDGPSYMPKGAEPGLQREVVTLHGAPLPCLYMPSDPDQPLYVTHVSVNGAWVPACEFGDDIEQRWHEEVSTVLGEPERIEAMEIRLSNFLDRDEG